MEENETVPKYSADICRDILNYTWNVSIEILNEYEEQRENGEDMSLTYFFKELKNRTNRYIEEKLGLNSILCIISDQLWRPAYYEQLDQGIIDVDARLSPLEPEADLSTITLVRNDEPDYSKDYITYINAHLQKF